MYQVAGKEAEPWFLCSLSNKETILLFLFSFFEKKKYTITVN